MGRGTGRGWGAPRRRQQLTTIVVGLSFLFGQLAFVTATPASSGADAVPTTITVTKVLGGERVAAGDQFDVQVATTGNVLTRVSSTATSTTTGTAATADPGTGTTGPTVVDAGTSYEILETNGNAGTDLTPYSVLIDCNDANGVTPDLPDNNSPTLLEGGTARGLAITPSAGADISCTITNTPTVTTVSVDKALSGTGRATPTDQFTTTVAQSGTTVSDPAAATTTGSGTTVDAGTGTTGDTNVTPTTAVTVNETAGNAGTDLGRYDSTITCTDAAGLVGALPDGQSLDPANGATVTPKAGSAIHCTITNTPKSGPTIKVVKELSGPRVKAGDQFTPFIATDGGAVVSDPTNATTTGTGQTVDPGTGTTGTYDASAGQALTIGETSGNAGTDLALYTPTVSCVDDAGIEDDLPDDASLGTVVSPQAGAVITCTITNTPKLPTVTVVKSLGGARVQAGDQFTVTVDDANGVVSDPTNATTTGSGSTVDAGTGTSGAVTGQPGDSLSVDEVAAGTTDLAAYTAVVTCSDANELQADLPTFAPLSTGVPLGPLVAGAAITCTITNTPAPNVSITKTVVGGPTPDLQGGFDIAYDVTVANAGGPTTYDLSDTLQFGSGITTGPATINALPGAPQPLAGWNGITATTVVTNAPIAAGATHTFRVNAKGTPTGQVTNASAACQTDPVAPGGLLNGATVTVAGQPTTAYACQPLPPGTISVQKAFGGPRVNADDQFSVYVLHPLDGGPGGDILSNTQTGITTGTGATVDPGTGFSGVVTPAAGESVRIYEIGKVQQYVGAYACTDANGIVAGDPLTVGATYAAPDGAVVLVGAALTCTITNTPKAPTVTVVKELGGPRGKAGDQFTPFIATDGGAVVSDPTNATTTGTGQTVDPGTGTTGAYAASAGQALTISETAGNPGTDLGAYTSTVSCVDAAGIEDALPDDAPLGTVVSPQAGAIITCTITNTPKPPNTKPTTITVDKELSAGGRAEAGDQFTVQIADDGGTVVSDPTNATTTGTGATVDIGTGTTGAFAATPGDPYVVGEAPANAGTDLAGLYDATVTCTDATGLTDDLPVDGQVDGTDGQTIVPLEGSAITCTITNTPKPGTISVTKALAGNRVNAADQFDVQLTDGGLNGGLAQGITTGTGSTVDPGSGTTGDVVVDAGLPYDAVEIAAVGTPTNLAQYSQRATCTDDNGRQPAGSLPTDAVLDVTAANGKVRGIELTLAAGAAVRCTITNTPLPSTAQPTITVVKALGGPRAQADDQFTVTATDTSTGLLTGPGTATTTGTGSTLDPATGTTGTITSTVGHSVTVGETAAGTTDLARYDSVVTCADANEVQADLPTFAPLSTGVPVGPLVAGAAITCTITNTAKPVVLPPPTITVQKALGSVRAKGADQFSVLIASGGTTVSDPTHATTTGADANVDPGTGTTGTFAATAGTGYVVDEEAGNPDTHLESYTATVTCTDANGLQPGLPSDAPLIPGTGAAITPVAGAAITCTIDNGVKRGTIRVQKALGDERLAPTDQFKVNVTSQEPDTKGQVINDQTHATTTGSGSTVDPGTGDTGTTDARDGKVMVTEDFPGHRYDGTLTCTDRNGVVSGTPEQIGRRYYGDTTTVPRGAALECTLTNVQSKPFLILRKAMGGPRVQDTDQFTVAVEQGGTIVSDQFVATTTGTGASIPGPGGITFYRNGTGGQTYGFTELPSGTTDLADYTATITCSDVTGLQPDLPTNAPLGGTFTITARNATQVDCTITNTPKPIALAQPTLSVQALLAGDRAQAGDQFTAGITSGGVVVNDTTHSTTTGSGAAVDPGTGTTGTYDATSGAGYEVFEDVTAGAARSRADLARYGATVTCTDANGLQPGLPTDQPYTDPVAIVPVAGAAIHCAITNTPKPAVNGLTVQKSVVGTPTLGSDGTWTIRYAITVTNLDATPTTYSLDDHLLYGGGIQVGSAHVGYAARADQVVVPVPSGSWNGLTDTRIITDQSIDGSTTDTYAVTVQATLSTAATATSVDCTLETGEAGSGFLNQASIEVAISSLSTEACFAPNLPSPPTTTPQTVPVTSPSGTTGSSTSGTTGSTGVVATTTTGGNGVLATTGAKLGMLLGLGSILLATGLLLTSTRRRRRPAHRRA